ncbi:MAG: GH92 family glycosyl hydrolase [Rikenellaceae bacterium]|nr:GH92 family glycosyl hydrolase [Rikenellaceae bacterium]
MKQKLTPFLYAAICAMAASCASDRAAGDYLGYVDPMIGAGGHGHVFVGSSVPFGAVQIGPQNIHKGWDWCSGYHHSDSVIIGFSHTHLSGTGCTDLGDILVMPLSGEIRTFRGEQNDVSNSAATTYSHDNETVAPDCYSLLMDNGIKAELTATERVALHRYTFPEGAPAYLLVNLREGNGDQTVDTYIRQVDPHTVAGYRISRGWSPEHRVYFTLESREPIKELLVYNDDTPAGRDSLRGPGVKGVLVFDGNPREAMFKVAISSVSSDNAAANMAAELPHWDFDRVRAESRDKWNRQLARIDIQTPDESKKRVFYTAMYHTAIAPTLYCDVNGEYRGHDGQVYKTDSKNYSTFSLWDTYRALHPLFTVTQTEMLPDLVNSMLSIHDQQQKLPVWPLVGGETDQMPGYSAVPVIADAYLKGIGGFDPERAFAACRQTAMSPRMRGVQYVVDNGFIPAGGCGEETSVAMEYAVDDWGIAAMARRMGKAGDADYFGKRGRYYEYYFDTTINHARPRLADGSWKTPYDPFNSVHGDAGNFCEGTGWQYTFFVPQNPEGLIALMGGDEPFIAKLDSLFSVEGEMGDQASVDISGLIGQYAHGNEPSHHIVYLYPYAGEQWKTAEKVRYIQDNFYTDRPDGIIGNEDCGQMSAWHILSALGFYQVNPSNGVFVFGSPLFDRAEVALPAGKSFVVEAVGNTPDNVYIQSVKLNGQPYSKAYITYPDIMAGGTLTFEMGPKPNPAFGSAPADRPQSI